jgi:hypothetical protein
MASMQNDCSSDVLRARYAELVRLREYVERLENLREGRTAQETPINNVVAERGSSAIHPTN